jgi:hypothetical protein
MRVSVAPFVVLVLFASCTELPLTEPELSYDGSTWFENERQQLTVRWPAAESCSNSGWNCERGPLPRFRITAVTCDGCRAIDVPYNKTYFNADGFDFEATTTDPITIDVEVESGGTHRTLTRRGMGDRELAVHVRCQVVPTVLLAETNISSNAFHDCGPTRRPQDTVVLSVSIHTFHGTERYPFCPDDARCSPAWPRKTSSISYAPAPDAWRWDSALYSRAEGATVTVSAPLNTGEISTTTVMVPPIAPAP